MDDILTATRQEFLELDDRGCDLLITARNHALGASGCEAEAVVAVAVPQRPEESMMRVQITEPEQLDSLLKFLRERGHHASRSGPDQVLLTPPAREPAARAAVRRELAIWYLGSRELAWIVPE